MYTHSNTKGDVTNLQEGLYYIKSKLTGDVLHYEDSDVAVLVAENNQAESDYYDLFDIKRSTNNNSYWLRTIGKIQDTDENSIGTHYRCARRNNTPTVIKMNGAFDNNDPKKAPTWDYVNFQFEHYDGPYYFIKNEGYYCYITQTEDGEIKPGDLRYNRNNNGVIKPTEDLDRYLFDLRWMGYSVTDYTSSTTTQNNDTANKNPIYSMVYSSDTQAKATLSIPTAAGYKIDTTSKPSIIYSINNGANQTKEMNFAGEVATVEIDGLNASAKDKVSYIIRFKGNDGVTRSTMRSIYEHTKSSTFSTSVPWSNETVNLGESIEVKSNQIAYLVPPECIGVQNHTDVLIGKNPMTAQDYVNLMDYADNTSMYPNFEIVDFDKTISGINKKLKNYNSGTTAKDPGYQKVFVQVGGDTMVYFYVDFTPENTSQYFKDYYSAHQSSLEGYMKQYAKTLKTGNSMSRLMLAGNMVQSSVTTGGKIDIKSYGNNGLPLTTSTEINELRAEELAYQQQFRALCSSLTTDFSGLSNEQKGHDVFYNLIKNTAFSGIKREPADPTVFSATYGSGTGAIDIKAIVIDNENSTAVDKTFVYNGTGNQQGTCLILASGDVRISKDFNGTVIAKGNIVVDQGVTIRGNREHLRRILQVQATPSTETILKHFFNDVDSYVAQDSTRVSSTTGYVDYSQNISYVNWSKE
jgi:hypothetical protein